MTVPYAVPPTAVAGQPLAAADWNTKIRDSIESVARPPSAIAYKNVDQLVGNAALSIIQWSGVSAQTDTFWVVGTPGRLTIPANLGGRYLFTANPIWDINGAGGRYATILKNGNPTSQQINSGGSAAWYTQHEVSAVLDMVPGDYAEVQVYQNSGGALNLKCGTYLSVFTATRLGV